MSRLFSHLENIGRDPTAVAPTDPAPGPDSGVVGSTAGQTASVSVPHAGTAPTSFARNVSGQAGNAMPFSPPLIPGYAIATELALPGPIAPPPARSRPLWTVRLWFFSLLALIGFSLAMLLVPVPAPVAETAPVRDGAPAGETAPVAPTVQDSAVATALPPAPAGPKPPPAASEPRPAREAAPPAPPMPVSAPPDAASRASCSEAMAAMNLCSTPAR